jgi:hypothetical protein
MEYRKTVGRKRKVSSIIIPTISGNSCHGLSIILTANVEWGSSDGNKFCGMRHHVVGNEGKHSVVYVGHRAAPQFYMIWVGGGEHSTVLIISSWKPVIMKGMYILLGLFMLIVVIQKLHFEYDLNNTSILVIPHIC